MAKLGKLSHIYLEKTQLWLFARPIMEALSLKIKQLKLIF